MPPPPKRAKAIDPADEDRFGDAARTTACVSSSVRLGPVTVHDVPRLSQHGVPGASVSNDMGWAGEGGEEVHRTGYNQLIEDQLVREGAARRHV
jgi:hypothetical protein|eukprot:COSAG01_NODE_20157_length_967_cov_4.656682_1_plen_94_part_00